MCKISIFINISFVCIQFLLILFYFKWFPSPENVYKWPETVFVVAVVVVYNMGHLPGLGLSNSQWRYAITFETIFQTALTHSYIFDVWTVPATRIVPVNYSFSMSWTICCLDFSTHFFANTNKISGGKNEQKQASSRLINMWIELDSAKAHFLIQCA